MLIDVPSNQRIQKDYPNTQRIQKDFPNTRRIQKDVPDDQKTSETEEDHEDLSGSRPFAIEYLLGICLLDTLHSQIECDEMSLHGHLFTVFLVPVLRCELLYAIASMSEIG